MELALLSMFNLDEASGFNLWGLDLLVVDFNDNSYNGYCYYFSLSIISAALNVPVPANEVRLAFLALCPLLFNIPEEPTLVDEDTAVDFLLDISVPRLLLLPYFYEAVLTISLVLLWLLDASILVLPYADGFLFCDFEYYNPEPLPF